ncbi:MAG: MazG-like family protein [Planctomycetota bacterium]
MDDRHDLRRLTDALLRFRRERDWEQFHNPKDQMLSLSLEAAELLELAQWKNGQELDEHLVVRRRELGDELADVLGWVLLIAHDQQIDLADAFEAKLAANAQKYPVDASRGRAEKWTAYANAKASAKGDA